jgi:hypothetical protein
MVIAPAKTGREKRSKNAVIKTDHTNKGNLCIDKPGTLILNMVVIKFIAPSKEETPAKWRLKIAKSTEPPECATIELKGGYTVQPVPAPNSTNDDESRRNKDGGNNQKLILFNLGNRSFLFFSKQAGLYLHPLFHSIAQIL